MFVATSNVVGSVGIATVAECDESEAMLVELKRIGVDFAQGFHLARLTRRPTAGLIWPWVVKVTPREPVSPVNRGLDTPELPISEL
jgi:EAL domain-containing protein (putative c-di-GMP-specific phosphodiesterase class I)